MGLPSSCRDKTSALVLAALAGLILSSIPPMTHAQEPIRVETNEVLVPVTVYDEEQYWLFQKLLQQNSSSFWQTYFAGDIESANRILESDVIHDLAAADFQLFEDGKEQAIRKVTYEQSLYWNVRDNRRYHTEFMGPGGGKWTTAAWEWPSNTLMEIDPPYYLIAYRPPQSPEGSCHKIRIKVLRHNALILNRSEYCNIRHSVSDPLSGTKLGDQLQSQLASEKVGKIDASLLAVPFLTDSGETRIHVAFDWPSSFLDSNSSEIGVLEVVFEKEGRALERFTDLFESAEGNYDFNGKYGFRHFNHALTRYERQFGLPPGEYIVRGVVSDGKRYGRGEFPVTVEIRDRKELAMSGVSLCKQISDMSPYSSERAPKLPGAWGAKLPGGYVPLVSKGYEYKPTGNTRFKKDETVYTYFEVYEPLLAEQSPPDLKMQVRIVDATTGKIKTDSRPESVMQYVKAGSTTIPIGLGVDTSMLPKGSYRLEVQVTDSAGQSTLWRTATFAIE